MNIDKAIRKQKKSYKRFLLSMCFIFFILPAVLVLSKKFYIFYIAYLVVVEILIFLAIIIRINNETLKFSYDGYRLKLQLGLNGSKINILCDKIALVHVEDYISGEQENIDFKVILISRSRFRSDRMIPISEDFFNKHPFAAHEYRKIKVIHPEDDFYFTIVRRGGLNKYPLLDTIYKSCVYANFTQEAIERIKYYRENSENYEGRK